MEYTTATMNCCRSRTMKKPSTAVGELEIQVYCRETKHHARKVGESRFITPVGPKELTLPALCPEQRSYRMFIDSA